jgi:F-type H+/Na+-transporting ATPase subunit alpha
VSRVGGSAQIKAMKKVAGRLRLDLAQFRELEAFAQFGSDLDAATQRQLARGERTVEMLKQPQYEPMPVENQVAVIYAVTNGYLDDVPVARIKKWERGYHDFLKVQRAEILAGLREGKVLTEEIESALIEATQEYTAGFLEDEGIEVDVAETAGAEA